MFVSDDDRAAMRHHTGYAACPLVVAGDQIIGKLEDTIEADRSGRLATLLGGPDSPAERRDGGNPHA